MLRLAYLLMILIQNPELVSAGLVFIPMIPLWPFVGYLTAILLVAGIIIGILGSTISLRKYMKV